MEIRIKDQATGSLIILFGAVISAYSLVSQYKDFYESVRLIKTQAQSLVERAVEQHGPYSAGVQAIYPSLDRWQDALDILSDGPLRRRGPSFPLYRVRDDEARHQYRDGFFYFLLILCMVEFVMIVMLVSAAVMKVYF